MVIEVALGYKGSLRILLFLSQSPIKSISRKDIKKYTYLGNEALNTALNRLTLLNILIFEKKRKSEYYYLNMDNNEVNLILEVIKNERRKLKNIPIHVHFIINELLRKLLDKIETINYFSLFGSYAKGTANTNSDVDIALVYDKNTKDELIIRNICDELENIFKIKIQVHTFSKDEFKKGNKLIAEIKLDGIEVITEI